MMLRKPAPLVDEQAHKIIDAGLALKDGARELRFNFLRGARRLIEGAQVVVHQDKAHPLSLLGQPLDRVVSFLRILRTADRAAVDLLSTDGPYRCMSVPLQSTASYFSAGMGLANLPRFIQDHYWRYRHWITLKSSKAEVFVREQGIERAGLQACSALAEAGRVPGRQQINAQVILALSAAHILDMPGDASGGPSQAAFCTVLAGEIAPRLVQLGASSQTAAALELADEIAAALRPNWEKALQSPHQTESLAACLEFALRHL